MRTNGIRGAHVDPETLANYLIQGVATTNPTLLKKAMFLASYSATGLHSQAMRAARVSGAEVRAWKGDDPCFNEELEHIKRTVMRKWCEKAEHIFLAMVFAELGYAVRD